MFPPPKLKRSPALQFRAGKMKYANGIVSPDTSKGYLSFVKKSPDTIEVVWTGSESNSEETHTWKKNQVDVGFVSKCATGRVILFKVTDLGKEKLLFFWLQDKSDAKDATHMIDLKAMFQAAPAASGATPQVQLEDLQKILANISGGGAAAKENVSLPSIIASSKVSEVVRADPDFYKSRLQETLPTELASSGDILEQIKNPQVSQAAAMLGAALKDPETCRELCRMYGLPENTVGVSGFLTAIMNQAKKPE